MFLLYREDSQCYIKITLRPSCLVFNGKDIADMVLNINYQSINQFKILLRELLSILSMGSVLVSAWWFHLQLMTIIFIHPYHDTRSYINSLFLTIANISLSKYEHKVMNSYERLPRIYVGQTNPNT